MAPSSSAAELISSVERELNACGKSPKAMVTLTRARQAVEALESARREGSEREDELLQLLVENLAPTDGEGNLLHAPGSPTRSVASATPRATLAAAAHRHALST